MRREKYITQVTEPYDQVRSSLQSNSQHPACTYGVVRQRHFSLNKFKFRETGMKLKAVTVSFYHEENNIFTRLKFLFS